AGYNVAKAIVMLDPKPLKQVRDQSRQSPAARKDHTEAGARFIFQIADALPGDCFGLFRKVCADQKIERFLHLRTSPHFQFAKKRIAERDGGYWRSLGLPAHFFPGTDPA